MSDTVGTISVDLTLDDAKFNRALAVSETKAAAAGQAIDKELSGATSRTEARFASFGSIATKALGLTGIAAGVAGLAAVKMAGNFEQSLNVFQSVSGATAKQMELVAAKARELGKDASLPGISARDAAQALTELAKAGLDVNQSLAASKGVLSLAKAGNLAVADAASIAAKALNAFGLAGSQATRVADLLAAAANASSADVSDIALGLAQVGAGAKQMGVSLQDTVTSLALFTNAGIRGQDAGTSLKQMFIQLATPTAAASKLMKKLGLDFFDAKGNFIGLEKSSGLLQTKLKGLTVEQRNNALATIFGSDSMRVAAILADQGAAGFDKMAKAVNKQGAATELAAAQNRGFNGALDNFISTVQTVATDLGTKLLPPLTEFLRTMADKLPAAVQFLTDNFAVLVSVVGGLGAAFAVFKIAAIVKGFIDLVIVIRAAAAAAGIFSAALDANPIGLVALAIAAVVAGLIFLQLKFNILGKAMNAVRPAIDAVASAFRILGLGISAMFAAMSGEGVTSRGFVGFMERIGVALMPVFAGLQQVRFAVIAFFAALNGEGITSKGFVGQAERIAVALRAIISAIAENTISAIRTAMRSLSEALGPAFKEIGASISALTQAIKPLLPLLSKMALVAAAVVFAPAIASVGAFVAALYGLSVVLKFLAPAIGFIVKLLADFITISISNLAAVINFLVASFQAVVAAVQFTGEVFKQVFGAIANVVQAGVNAVIDAFNFFKPAIDLVVFIFQSFYTVVFTILSAIAQIVFTITKTIAEIIAVAFLGTAKFVYEQFLKPLFDFFVSVFTAIVGFLVTVGGAIYDAVAGPIGAIVSFMGGALSSIFGTVSSVFTSIYRFVAGISGSILAAITGSFNGAKAGVTNSLADTYRAVLSFVGNFINAGVEIINGIVRGVASGSAAVVNKIKEICAQSLDAVKKFFGIHSPSTVMADMGENLMKGLADGIASAGNLATSAMTAVSSDLVSALAIPDGNFSLTGDAAGGLGAGSSRTFNQNNVFNVMTQVDPELIANDVAWRAKRAG
jgi:TP901 family phage tail tape measure protein